MISGAPKGWANCNGYYVGLKVGKFLILNFKNMKFQLTSEIC